MSARLEPSYGKIIPGRVERERERISKENIVVLERNNSKEYIVVLELDKSKVYTVLLELDKSPANIVVWGEG